MGVLVVAAVLGVIAASVLGPADGIVDSASAPGDVRAVGAPPQHSARIAALRTRPGNPPRFALLTLGERGSAVRVLVNAPAAELERLGQLVWSADATRLYYIGILGEREGDRFSFYESDLFAVAAAGGDPRRLTTSGDVAAVAPAPGSETLLVGRSERPGALPVTYSLWLTDANGRNERRLVGTQEGQVDLLGSWSPDGRTVAFTRCRLAPLKGDGLVQPRCAVHTVSADGSGLVRLADRGAQPAFSPDGRRIAFVSNRDRHGRHSTGSDEDAFSNELYVMDADGNDQRRLTETESLDEATPAWSPDASRLVYARTGPARFQEQLMIVNEDGTCPTRLIGDATATQVGAPSFEWPSWRPGRLTGELAQLACP